MVHHSITENCNKMQFSGMTNRVMLTLPRIVDTMSLRENATIHTFPK